MRATFAVFAIFSLYSLAFKLDARKELDENAPLKKSESKPNISPYWKYQKKSPLNDFQPISILPIYLKYKSHDDSDKEKSPSNNFEPKHKFPINFKYQNGGAGEQEKSLLNDFQHKPNNPLFFYQSGGADEQEKSPLKDFQHKPNNPLFFYQNGGADEQEKSPLNDFQDKPNNPLFFYASRDVNEQEKVILNDFQLKLGNPGFFYQSGGAEEQEKLPLNDFQCMPNDPLFFIQSGGADEEEKSPVNDFRHKTNNPLFFYQSGDVNEQEKITLNDFQLKPNNPLFFFQSGGANEKEKSPRNDFQHKSNNPLFFYQSGGADEQEKSPLDDFQQKPNNPLFFYQSGGVDEQEKSLLNDVQPKPKFPIYFKYKNKGNNLLSMHDMNSNSKHDSSVHGHHNLAIIIPFTKNDLKVGNKLPVYLPAINHSSKDPPLLPREQAESYPFSYKQFHYLLDLFSVAPNSPQAKSMEEALVFCESKPISGETKFCATSFESMIDFVSNTFGLASENFKAVTSMQLTKSKNKKQNYTITEEPKEIQTAKLISCHPMSYPYKVFYCHTPKDTKVFRVSLVGENGDVIDAIAACHFREVGGKPTDVCHFFPSDHMVWIPAEA